jgi:eukaryotic-like serine/threonine-protein kinase
VESTHTLVHAREAPGRGGWAGPPQPGALLFGRYRLLERLGAGGFGVVWRARDEMLHRGVAVKRIPLLSDGDGQRPSREALAAARLAHPAIVALYEACAAPDAFYLISELVHGETLARLIRARTLDDGQVLEIGIALAGALRHAHSRGVIHRDVKPQNVLVPDRHADPEHAPQAPPAPAKLTDFGGARLAGEDLLTRTGDVLGTLAYMAPEQCEGEQAGPETDLYSLALVLYEALSGTNPIRGATPAATARRIGRPLEPLERRRGDLARPLTRALDRALQAAPGDRGTLEQLSRSFAESLARGRPGRLRPAPRGRRATAAARRDAVHGAPGSQPQDDVAHPCEPGGGEQAEHARPATQPDSAAAHAGDERRPGEHPGRLALPRVVWIACALAAAAWQAWAGRPGVSLLLLVALAPLLALPRRAGPAWLVCALAPALGLARLAGAFPAVAGQASRWRARAALGALGYWWLTLAEPLLARSLWLGPASPTPPRAAWEGSASTAATHVIAPALSLGVLAGAALWAAGAACLPWIVRGRSAAVDVVAATMWSAVLVTAVPVLQRSAGGYGAHATARGAVLGAVLGGLVAVAARALRGPV